MHLWQKSVVLNRETLESREKKKLGDPSLLLKKCLFMYLRLAGLSLSFCARCSSSERATLLRCRLLIVVVLLAAELGL